MLLLLFAATAAGREVAGVTVPETVDVAGHILQLNGAGLRTRFFFKVYVMALYLPKPARTAAEVLDGEGPRRVTLHLLRALDVHDLRITDAGLAHVGKLAALEDLRIGESRITDDGLAELKGLSLRRLDLEKGTITGAGLRHVDVTRLEELTFEEAPRADDAALEALRGAKALRRLNLEETAVTDAGMACLAECRALEWLDIDHTRVTDAGIAHLAGLPNLKTLSIDDTFVTDAAVEHLARMRGLRRLTAEDTKITEDGLARLRAALPGCEVRR